MVLLPLFFFFGFFVKKSRASDKRIRSTFAKRHGGILRGADLGTRSILGSGRELRLPGAAKLGRQAASVAKLGATRGICGNTCPPSSAVVYNWRRNSPSPSPSPRHPHAPCSPPPPAARSQVSSPPRSPPPAPSSVPPPRPRAAADRKPTVVVRHHVRQDRPGHRLLLQAPQGPQARQREGRRHQGPVLPGQERFRVSRRRWNGIGLYSTRICLTTLAARPSSPRLVPSSSSATRSTTTVRLSVTDFHLHLD